MPTAPAMARTVQCVGSWAGGSSVCATTFSTTSSLSGATPGGRVFSRSKPCTPCAMKRSCHRHKQVLDLPVAAMIAVVPKSCSVSRTIRARQRCLRGEPRAETIASSPTLSEADTSIVIPVRIQRHRTSLRNRETKYGGANPKTDPSVSINPLGFTRSARTQVPSGAMGSMFGAYSTVTDLARLRGWSTSVPFARAV